MSTFNSLHNDFLLPPESFRDISEGANYRNFCFSLVSEAKASEGVSGVECNMKPLVICL